MVGVVVVVNVVIVVSVPSKEKQSDKEKNIPPSSPNSTLPFFSAFLHTPSVSPFVPLSHGTCSQPPTSAASFPSFGFYVSSLFASCSSAPFSITLLLTFLPMPQDDEMLWVLSLAVFLQGSKVVCPAVSFGGTRGPFPPCSFSCKNAIPPIHNSPRGDRDLAFVVEFCFLLCALSRRLVAQKKNSVSPSHVHTSKIRKTHPADCCHHAFERWQGLLPTF